jgi:DNA-binding response OmpR family regulator
VVLLVEDDLDAHAELAARLGQVGFSVHPASDAASMRLRVDGGCADLLVISAEFGRDTGGDWMAELARCPRWREVPVIALTSLPESLFADALRRAGVPVLAKPVDDDALRRALLEVGIAARS